MAEAVKLLSLSNAESSRSEFSKKDSDSGYSDAVNKTAESDRTCMKFLENVTVMRSFTVVAIFVVNATTYNQDVVWSFCDLESSCAIALKLEWTPVQLNSSNPVIP